MPRWERALHSGLAPEAGRESLESRDLALETIMLGLRTADGIELAAFRRRFDVDLIEGNSALVKQSQADGLLRHESGRLTPTVRGMAVADGLAASFEI